MSKYAQKSIYHLYYHMELPLKAETETLKESVSKFPQFLLSKYITCVIFEAFSPFFFLETDAHYVALTDLELTMQTKLTEIH